ncbi:MAG: PAAR domain-containing protein [Chloroflexota bacterium]|nr:PAAR domain-containing protein [Chloroflexota bacterium]MDQ6906405.1 PAAR domain-containing protein [Chloroflexota bacterium]
MGKPAAKQGDRIVGVDIHIVMIPAPPAPPIPTPLPSPFMGMITGGCIASVKIMGMPAAVVGSTADNIPPHIPAGGPFQKQPTNKGKILMGSATVLIGGKMAARTGDTAMTCNDPVDMPNGTVVAVSTVFIGG